MHIFSRNEAKSNDSDIDCEHVHCAALPIAHGVLTTCCQPSYIAINVLKASHNDKTTLDSLGSNVHHHLGSLQLGSIEFNAKITSSL